MYCEHDHMKFNLFCNVADECGALESVKAASELYCPVSGTVMEKNTQVEDKPALINQSCYEEGMLKKYSLNCICNFTYYVCVLVGPIMGGSPGNVSENPVT